MPHIELRTTFGSSDVQDLSLMIQDQTFDYLLNGTATDIRVSAYFEKDYAQVLETYAELFLITPSGAEPCKSQFKVGKVTPGSKTRKVALPCAMRSGEQLTIQVTRA